jgi:hypothetical protein
MPSIQYEAGLGYPGSYDHPGSPPAHHASALVAHVQGGLTLGPEWGGFGAEKYNHDSKPDVKSVSSLPRDAHPRAPLW